MEPKNENIELREDRHGTSRNCRAFKHEEGRLTKFVTKIGHGQKSCLRQGQLKLDQDAIEGLTERLRPSGDVTIFKL